MERTDSWAHRIFVPESICAVLANSTARCEGLSTCHEGGTQPGIKSSWLECQEQRSSGPTDFSMNHLPPTQNLDHVLVVTIGTASSEVSVYVLYLPSCCPSLKQSRSTHTNSPWALPAVPCTGPTPSQWLLHSALTLAEGQHRCAVGALPSLVLQPVCGDTDSALRQR